MSWREKSLDTLTYLQPSNTVCSASSGLFSQAESWDFMTLHIVLQNWTDGITSSHNKQNFRKLGLRGILATCRKSIFSIKFSTDSSIVWILWIMHQFSSEVACALEKSARCLKTELHSFKMAEYRQETVEPT